jgi:thioredoxin reductase (NADPH)
MLVRSGGLAETMSRYLIRRIEESPAITLRTRTEIVDLMGNGELTGVRGGTARAARSRNARCAMCSA